VVALVLADNSPTPMAGRSKRAGGRQDGAALRLLRVAIAWLVLWHFMVSPAFGQVATPVPKARNVDDLPRYQLDVTFDDQARTIGGTLDLVWRNTTGTSQPVLWFRLYPNAAHYGGGGTVVSQVEVDGERAPFDPEPEERAAMSVRPTAPVAAGDEVTVRMAFTTTLSTADTPRLAMLGGDRDAGWRLADWFPMFAGWEDGEGWYLAPPTRFGDPTFADAARWSLRLAAPSAYTVIGSGRTVASERGHDPGVTVTTIEATAGRDVTVYLRAGTAEGVTKEAASMQVTTYLPPEAVPVLARDVDQLISDALTRYTGWMGALPDRELDVVAMELDGQIAVTWNGMIWIDLDAISPGAVRFILAHELAHLWIGGVIGSNNNEHGFLSEGLANHLALLVLREVDGTEVAAHTLESVAAPYRDLVGQGKDGVADQGITDDTDLGKYVALVYGKGTLGFEALRQELGHEAYLDWLAGYTNACWLAVCSPGEAKTELASIGHGSAAVTWSHWLEADDATVDGVDAVLAAFRVLM
jgi:hypothetical protein